MLSFTVKEAAFRVEVKVTPAPDVTTILFKGLVKPTALEKTKEPWLLPNEPPCKVRFWGVVGELLLTVFSKETTPVEVVIATEEYSKTGFFTVIFPEVALLITVERFEKI